jgi:lysophospholipase L1-like esterase
MSNMHLNLGRVTASDGAATGREAALPRRDWILLPLLSLVTIGMIAGSTELIARRMFAASTTGVGSCLSSNPLNGMRGIPNSMCWQKNFEGQPVEYRFNSSGYRADVEFGPKPPGTYRIVMVGSSTPMGYEVKREEAFATLLPAELSQLTGRRVELFNESMEGWGGTLYSIALRLRDALAVQPDMVLWVLGPNDIETVHEALPTPGDRLARPPGLPERAWQFARATFEGKSSTGSFAEVLDHSRSSILLRHFLYQSQSLYVSSILMQGRHDAQTLRAGPSQDQQRHLEDFDSYAAGIETRARAAGVLLVVTYVPNHGALAALVSKGVWPANYSPYEMDDELRAIILRHGGTYIDILPDFRNMPNPEKGYFPVDGHPNANGHAVIARLLAKELTGGAIPELKAAAESQTAPEHGR